MQFPSRRLNIMKEKISGNSSYIFHIQRIERLEERKRERNKRTYVQIPLKLSSKNLFSSNQWAQLIMSWGVAAFKSTSLSQTAFVLSMVPILSSTSAKKLHNFVFLNTFLWTELSSKFFFFGWVVALSRIRLYYSQYRIVRIIRKIGRRINIDGRREEGLN